MSAPRSPLLYAHRGASVDHPENTEPAFRGAVEQGADAVELDVRLAADGALLVHHDPVFPGGASVHAAPPEQRPAGCLELAAALDACAPLLVNVEIKNSPGDLGPDAAHDLEVAAAVVALLDRRRDGGVEERIEISSFDVPTLEAVRALGSVPTALLLLEPHAEAIEASATAGDVAVNLWDPMVDGPLVQRCHELGLAVNVWTVDDPGRIVELAAIGVDGIITNVPAVARTALS